MNKDATNFKKSVQRLLDTINDACRKEQLSLATNDEGGIAFVNFERTLIATLTESQGPDEGGVPWQDWCIEDVLGLRVTKWGMVPVALPGGEP